MISIKIDIDKIAVYAYYEELVNKYTDCVVSTITKEKSIVEFF